MDHFNDERFDRRVQELMHKHHTPGVSIAIVQNDKMASKAYGHASLEHAIRCTPDTLFDIASDSKAMTAASVALLVEDEKYPDVTWAAKMSGLLPDDFVMAEESYTNDITVEDILSHRTGLPSHDCSYLGIASEHTDDARSVTRNLRNLPLAAPIRTKYMYCNMMFTVATHLVETITGQTFSDFLHERFFKPLDMKSSSLQPQQARERGLGDRLAQGHSWQKQSGTYNSFPAIDSPEAQGAGSIMASVNDYILWVKALMNQEGPITEAVYHGLTRMRCITNPTNEDPMPYTSPAFYTAGLEVSWYRGHKIIQHGGSIPGFNSNHLFLPDHKFGMVVMTNSTSGAIVHMILMHELIDEFLRVPVDERPDWEMEMAKQTDDKEEDADELKEKLCPGLKENEKHTLALNSYTGLYHSTGYHDVEVQVREGRLFIDAKDRGFGFTLWFEHVCHQTKFLAHLVDNSDGGDVPIRAEFELMDDRAVRFGLHIEEEMEEYIWFDRVEKE